MNKIKEILSIIFISYEFLFVAGFYLVYVVFQSHFIPIILALTEKEIFGYLIVFQGAILAFAFQQAHTIVNPKEKEKDLYNWSEFWRLKYRIYASVIMMFFSISLFTITWAIKIKMAEMLFCYLLVVSFSTPIITTFSLFMASLNLREIIIKNSG